jgi:hypothetical protein
VELAATSARPGNHGAFWNCCGLATAFDLPDGILRGAREIDGWYQTEAAAGWGCAFGFGCELAQSGQICCIAEITDGAKGGQAQGDIPNGH